MSWQVTVLGTNSAVPTPQRSPSAQVLATEHLSILIDCGEGTQVRMTSFGIKRSRIDHILITHLHGDHVFGLPGLLTSYNLFRRERKLSVYGPKGLRAFVTHNLEMIGTRMNYDLEIIEHNAADPKRIYQDQHLEIRTIPLSHRVPTTGYLFREKIPPRKIMSEKVTAHNIPYTAMRSLQQGEDWVAADGITIPNEQLTIANRAARSFAYCSDTAYKEDIIDQLQSIDLLYHEATFLHELEKEAVKRMHSTAKQAAIIAKKAGVKKLMIGHFSTRYKDPKPLLEEAKQTFEPTILAEEGLTVSI